MCGAEDALTVRLVEPETLPSVAEMVAEPAATPVASPLDAIVATPVEDEVQLALEVRLAVVPSLYRPVAVNCSVDPLPTAGLAGVTAIEASVAADLVTVTMVEPLAAPAFAAMLLAPGASPVTSPTALTEVTLGNEATTHCAVPVISVVVPSLIDAIAVSWI